MHQKGLSATIKYMNADKWSSQDKFMVVLETANLTEIEFSEYCREKHIYPEQVKEWKEKEKLEKELARKEKALAEAVALLVLRKKQMRFGGRTKRTNDQRFRSQTSSRVDQRGSRL